MKNDTLFLSIAATILTMNLAGCSAEDGAQGPPGDQGPQGEQGLQGDPGAPDTGQEILDKLSDVDGDGSGLDCDTLDGLDSSDLAHAGVRALQLAPQGGAMADAHSQYVQGGVLMPYEMVPDTEVTIRMWYLVSGTPCSFSILGGASGSTGSGINYSTMPELVAVPDGNHHEFEITIPGDEGIAGGEWIKFGVSRMFNEPGDDCFQVYVESLALEYTAM